MIKNSNELRRSLSCFNLVSLRKELPSVFEQDQSFEIPDFSCLDSDKKDLFLSTMAEWQLFCHICGIEWKGGFDFSDEHPFGEHHPPLKDLMKLRGAIACFPVANPAELCRIYCFEGGTHIFSKDRFDGNSYQLAKAVAQKLLERDDVSLQKNVALNYVMTGCFEKDHVSRIEIFDKFSVAKERKWIVPRDNEPDLPEDHPGQISFVSDLNEAIAKITGSAVKEKNFPFPEKVAVLHCLVGESLQPVLIPALLLQPQKLILWYSEETGEQGECCKKLLKRVIDEIELRFLPSDNLAESEKMLQKALENISPLDTYFSFTGGNRIMGFAALLAAKNYRIPIVYRDIDEADDTLIMIHFDDNGGNETGKITGNHCKLKDFVNWKEYLYKKNTRNKQPLNFEQEYKKLWLK